MMRAEIVSAAILVQIFFSLSDLHAQGAPEALSSVVQSLEQAAAARAKGWRRVVPPFSGTLGKRGAASFQVALPEAKCYQFLGVGGDGVQDLTLTLSVDGREVAADRMSGMRPAVKWCAPSPLTAAVGVEMYGGAGAFAIGVYVEADEGEAAEAVGGVDSDFVANRIRQLHEQFAAARGAVSPVIRGNLVEGGEHDFEVALRAGRCYTAIAVAEPSVRDLDIVISARSGEAIAKDETRSGFAVVSTSACLKESGVYTVKVRAARGRGQFGAQLFSD